MFVRKKKNRSGSTCVQIIQKLNGKYKVVRTLGSSLDESIVERLYLEAIEAIPRMFSQLSLYEQRVTPCLISELSNDSIRIVGPELIFGRIFKHIGYDVIKDSMFKDLVISRITHPGSKLQLSVYLQENQDKEISTDAIYYFLDKLSKKYKAQVEELTFCYTSQLLHGRIGIVFYDMTTIYFESSQPDELRIPGFSKDGKHQNPQIFLGLLVGENGYPTGYDIFEGNTYEGHTLIPVLERFQARFNLGKPIVVADAGLLSNDNLSALKKNGYTFILGARIKSESKAINSRIEALELEEGQVAEIAKEDGTKLFVSYSQKRAHKDLSNRERGLRRLEKSINTGRLTKSSINNRGYNKYLSMQGELKIAIDYEKFEADSKWDGLKGYITNTNLAGTHSRQAKNNSSCFITFNFSSFLKLSIAVGLNQRYIDLQIIWALATFIFHLMRLKPLLNNIIYPLTKVNGNEIICLA